MEAKYEISVRLYPVYYGLTADMLFWIAVSTLFLTVEKGFSPTEINTSWTIGLVVGLIHQLLINRIIGAIGRKGALFVRTALLAIAAIIFTFTYSLFFITVAEALYACSAGYHQQVKVILYRLLDHLGKRGEYVRIQTKGSVAYAVITFLIACIIGPLFNLNHYLPMACCIAATLIGFILTFFIHDTDSTDIGEENKNANNIEPIPRRVAMICVMFGLFYSLLSVSQENCLLLIQEDISFIFKDGTVMPLIIGGLIIVSRITRIVSNIIFGKVCSTLENKNILIQCLLFITSPLCMLLGHTIGGLNGIFVMAMGFFIILALRDPQQNYVDWMTIKDTNNKTKTANLTYLCRQVGTIMYTTMTAGILMLSDYVLVYKIYLAISIVVSMIYITIIKNTSHVKQC